MKCNRCQQEAGSAALINGLCQQCFWNPPPTQYHYKCPDCGGEFVNPSITPPQGNAGATYKCPFCGRIMQGMA